MSLNKDIHCVSLFKGTLKAVTKNAAFRYGEESEKGSIEIGKYVDFVILDKNPLVVPIKEISKIKVKETIFRDKTLYWA